LRLYVLSDLHLERTQFTPLGPDADVVVLAGDIARGTSGVEWARGWADGREVLYVAGNHEFYGHAAPDLIDELRRAAAGSSVRVLENDEAIIDGVRFLGCTMWSDFDYDGPERRAESMRVCGRVVNDYKHIEFGLERRLITPQDTRELHLRSRQWLRRRLAERHDGHTVVITHHAPLIRTKPQVPLLRALAGAFVSDLSDLMGEERVALWVYGHTHRSADGQRDGTRVLSNPRGYPHESVDGFDPARVIELGPTPVG
jgi:predicted phosphodiesterase